jgi:hypothetical protein
VLAAQPVSWVEVRGSVEERLAAVLPLVTEVVRRRLDLERASVR